MTRNWLAAGTVALLLAGCAPPAAPPAAKLQAPAQSLPDQMQALPGAEVQQGALIYPQGSLFSPGAALFYAGGTETLNPLAALLQRHPGRRWQGTVRAESDVSQQHALALAKTRARLLQRYFARKGISEGRISLGAEAVSGPDMTLQRVEVAQEERDSSSSPEKE